MGKGLGVSGHVFVVGADLTKLSCDDVLVPTDRTLRVAPSWCSLLPPELVTGHAGDGACVGLEWSGDGRVLEVPGDGERRGWLFHTPRGPPGAGGPPPPLPRPPPGPAAPPPPEGARPPHRPAR